jgi:hypothetical protein
MVDWQPIALEALRERIAQGVARMRPAHRRLWEAIRIEPRKWRLSPYGDAGGGFWAVAVIGASVIWYNDVEEGFNRSRYTRHGHIGDYWRNQDELDVTMEYLVTSIETGFDLLELRKTPKPVTQR